MANQTVGILGLGIFGQSIIEALISQDVEIIAIDNHEETINQYEDMIAVGVIGDITDMELLEAADVGACDTVVVATGESLESSVLAVMHCKALGVKNVIAKVKDEVTQQVLEKVGADLVILPEVEAGISLAKTILFNHSIEVFQLDDDVVVAEFELPASWVGKTVREVDARRLYHLNIIGYRLTKNQPLESKFTPDFVWQEGVSIMAVTDNQHLDNLREIVSSS